MSKISHVLAFASFVITAGGCATAAYAGDFFFFAYGDDLFAPYFQRKDSVTLSAGNAKAVNAASQIIDPWPRYVGNRRIPASGERMVGAVRRYGDVRLLPRAPLPISHSSGGTGGGLGGVGGGGLGGGLGGAAAGGLMTGGTGY
jgi:hypothetical protein